MSLARASHRVWPCSVAAGRIVKRNPRRPTEISAEEARFANNAKSNEDLLFLVDAAFVACKIVGRSIRFDQFSGVRRN